VINARPVVRLTVLIKVGVAGRVSSLALSLRLRRRHRIGSSVQRHDAAQKRETQQSNEAQSSEKMIHAAPNRAITTQ
jgi:hypothetical protein